VPLPCPALSAQLLSAQLLRIVRACTRLCIGRQPPQSTDTTRWYCSLQARGLSGAASLAADKVVATVGSVKAIPPYLETEAKALMLKVPMFRHLVLPGSYRKRRLL